MRYCLLRLILLPLLVMGCFPKSQGVQPHLTCTPQRRDIAPLPSPFPPLSKEEAKEPFAIEMMCAAGFAKDCDLYRAITSYKRALILIPEGQTARKLEITYQIAHCYYLGGKFKEAIETIEQSPLCYATADFPAYEEMLLLLYDAYAKTDQEEKGQYVRTYLEKTDPERAKAMELALSIEQGNLNYLKKSDILAAQNLYRSYACYRKSPQKAQILNAALPGAGFWYVGQKQTAITALIINALFIIGTWQLFDQGYFALGAVCGSLEAGWYFGGIYGAKEEAIRYNTKLYERLATPVLDEGRIRPLLMLRWGF